MASRKVTLASLDQKLDDLKEMMQTLNLQTSQHLSKLDAEIAPLTRFKNYAHGAIVIVSVVLTFLGWDYLRRLFIIEVIKP